jgi:hypothetical protein
MAADGLEYLRVRHSALEIVVHSNVAFYMECHDCASAEYHWSLVEQNFAEMAEKLGYRIKKIIFHCEECKAPVCEDDHGWNTDGRDLCGKCVNRLANEEFRAVTGWQPAIKEAADA